MSTVHGKDDEAKSQKEWGTNMNPQDAPKHPGDVVYFGRTDFRNDDRLFGIQRRDRRQHMYVVGKSGTGKSAMLSNLIIQDIVNGEGLCVVDPHGELVEGVLEKIPKSREADVVYFNPADVDYPMGFNILELPDPKYKHLVASGLMGIFTKIWANVWSARMEYILNNAVLALLETPNTTLLGVPRILVDKEYRQKIIANVKDPVVRSFWLSEFEEWQDKYRSEAIAPIQNKVGQFLSTAIVRNVVGQSKSTLDIFDLMNKGKILLVNVSKGRIGEDNSMLLGAMLITKIQLSAMERVRISEDARKDFYLYVDEFQNFATDSFANILSEARKYRLNLIMAHQYTGQLTTDTSTKVRDAVFGNVGTMVVFRVGAADAEMLEPDFEPEFTIQDIVNLPNYQVYLRLLVNGISSRPFSAKTLHPFKLSEGSIGADAVIEASRKRYARNRLEVEKEIIRWSSGGGAEESAPVFSEVKKEEQGVKMGKDGKTPMYPVTCSSCSKETHVPFKPTSGRPVYCEECLTKIQSGELKPVSISEMKKEESRLQQSKDALADLGIEFDRPKQPERRPTPPPTPRPMTPPQKPFQPPTLQQRPQQPPLRPPQTQQPAQPQPEKKELSLKDLKPMHTEPKVPHPPHHASNALKEMVQKAMEEKK